MAIFYVSSKEQGGRVSGHSQITFESDANLDESVQAVRGWKF